MLRAHESSGGPTSQETFWRRYAGLRALGLAYPVEGDDAALDGVRDAFQSWLEITRAEAIQHADRWALLRRDAAMHEMLTRSLAPAELVVLLDSMAVEGIERLQDARAQGRGVVFLSLHYSLYASLLVLWLARAASQGFFEHLAVLYVARPNGTPSTFVDAMQRSESAGFIPSSTIRLIDLGVGPVRATRNLISTVESGGAVLIFSDRLSRAGADRRSVNVAIARREVGIAGGVPWLIQTARAPVVPVFIRPDTDNRHAVVFGLPKGVGDGDDASTVVRSAMQYLADTAILADPDLWDGWGSLARIDTESALSSA